MLGVSAVIAAMAVGAGYLLTFLSGRALGGWLFPGLRGNAALVRSSFYVSAAGFMLFWVAAVLWAAGGMLAVDALEGLLWTVGRWSFAAGCVSAVFLGMGYDPDGPAVL